MSVLLEVRQNVARLLHKTVSYDLAEITFEQIGQNWHLFNKKFVWVRCETANDPAFPPGDTYVYILFVGMFDSFEQFQLKLERLATQHSLNSKILTRRWTHILVPE